MKTRIVYPKNIWYSKTFKNLTDKSKLLALYLVTNENIGLTQIYRQRDMELCFILGLTEKQLEVLKQEIQTVQLYFFKDEWVYINNDFSYCDYFRNKETTVAKEKELQSIPIEIVSFFKDFRLNEHPTEFERGSTINNKSKIINHKEGVLGGERKREYLKQVPDSDLETFSQRFNASTKNIREKAEELYDWTESTGKKKSDYKAFLRTILKKDFGYRPESLNKVGFEPEDPNNYKVETMARRP